MDFEIQGNDTLRLGEVSFTLQRTLRIPDDGRSYPLPPGLGAFPMRRVDDYGDKVPEAWRGRGGVFLPMYQREAMWLRFGAPSHAPRALKVGVGKVCAITGKPWRDALGTSPQDYVVAPLQPWLDGICAGRGTIRQFVAMPLGMGYTIEGQVTGEERFGGIQLEVFEAKKGRFPDAPPPPMCAAPGGFGIDMMECAGAAPKASSRRGRAAGAMGLAAGGRMKQKIYPDPHGIDTWQTERAGRVFVHIVNSELWREITGEEPPKTPVTAKTYAAHGLPWFELYDEHRSTLAAQQALESVKSVKELDAHKSTLPLQDDEAVPTAFVAKLWNKLVRDGEW